MTEPRNSITERPSYDPLSATGSLMKHNRDIAQAREQLDTMRKRLSDAQVRNSTLLEESSELDSEVSAQMARCRASEQSLAEVEEAARQEEEVQAQQEATHAEALSAARAKVEASEEKLRASEQELTAESCSIAAVDAEVNGLKETLQAQEAAVKEATRAREEYLKTRSVPSGLSAAARQQADAEREAIEVQCNAAKAQERSARQQVTELQAELLAENRRRDELKEELKEVGDDVQGQAMKMKELEATVAAKGGDASAILAECRAESSKPEDDDELFMDGPRRDLSRSSVTSIGAQKEKTRSTSVVLREDLQKVQEMQSKLDTGLATMQKDEDEDRLQVQLDNARNELQRSLRETAAKSYSEVSQLESEVQQERKRAAVETMEEQDCAERIEELKSTRRETQERARAAAESRQQQQTAEAARCSALSQDLASVRAEMTVAESRLTASTRRVAEAEARRANAEVEGGKRVAKAKKMIEDLWHQIRAQAVLVEAQASRSAVR